MTCCVDECVNSGKYERVVFFNGSKETKVYCKQCIDEYEKALEDGTCKIIISQI